MPYAQHRRARLEDLLGSLAGPGLALSVGMVGAGREFFRQVTATGHEGVMAKHLWGCCLPGRRTCNWRKIKQQLVPPCAILFVLLFC